MQGKIPFLLIIVCIYIMYTALCDGPEHQSEDYRLVQFNFICPGGGGQYSNPSVSKEKRNNLI